jgi:hypothetical protein
MPPTQRHLLREFQLRICFARWSVALEWLEQGWLPLGLCRISGLFRYLLRHMKRE